MSVTLKYTTTFLLHSVPILVFSHYLCNPMTDIDMTSNQENILHIKNMVCNRCIMVVKSQLQNLGLQPLSVELGIAVLPGKVTDEVYHAVKASLEPFGFELIDDKKSQVIEQIKDAIIQLVHYNDSNLKVNLSDYLTTKLNRDYSALSKLFSEATNTTIEKYFIAQKIERAKELLVYGELSLNEIADKLNYSSAAYLSAQFKSVTGLTPSYFKKIKENKRKPLDEV